MIEFLRHSPLYPGLLKLYLTLHKTLIWFCWQIFSLCPVRKDKIVLSNFNGNGFGDNPRYIAEEILRQKLPYRLYWVSERPDPAFPGQLFLVRPNTPAFVYHMSTASVWIDNTRKLYYFKKKKNQTYIQVWHGGPGLKKIEKDAGNSLSAEYIEYAKKDAEKMDLTISNCRWCTEC